MTPENNSHVKCLLRNNVIVEGFVENWTDERVILKSLDEKSLVIIWSPAVDIVTVKVILEKDVIISGNNKIKNRPVTKTEIAKKVKEVLESIPNSDLQDKSIAELKNLSKQQEKELILNKMKEHSLGQTKGVKYNYPGFFEKE